MKGLKIQCSRECIVCSIQTPEITFYGVILQTFLTPHYSHQIIYLLFLNLKFLILILGHNTALWDMEGPYLGVRILCMLYLPPTFIQVS